MTQRRQRGIDYRNGYAVKTDGTRQLLATLTADAKGTGAVNPLLKFFDAGFVRVEVQVF